MATSHNVGFWLLEPILWVKLPPSISHLAARTLPSNPVGPAGDLTNVQVQMMPELVCLLQDLGIRQHSPCYHLCQHDEPTFTRAIYQPIPDKLNPPSLECILVGYLNTTKGCCCHHPPTKRFYVSMDVAFDESRSYFKEEKVEDEVKKNEAQTEIYYSCNRCLASLCNKETKIQTAQQGQLARILKRNHLRCTFRDHR